MDIGCFKKQRRRNNLTPKRLRRTVLLVFWRRIGQAEPATPNGLCRNVANPKTQGWSKSPPPWAEWFIFSLIETKLIKWKKKHVEKNYNGCTFFYVRGGGCGKIRKSAPPLRNSWLRPCEDIQRFDFKIKKRCWSAILIR